jgi:predicted site-specific integrase-resolvase
VKLNGTIAPPATGLRAAKKVAEDMGVSAISLWRWARAGRLRIVRIANRPYVDLESLAEFQSAALDGKYETPLAGAARKSAEARAEKEGVV